MKRIANIEINTDGNHTEMVFTIYAETRCEQIAIGSYVARALLDFCEDIDPDAPGITALRFIGAATNLPRSSERVLS